MKSSVVAFSFALAFSLAAAFPPPPPRAANGVEAVAQMPACVTQTGADGVWIDFGKDAFGWLEFDVPAGATGEVVVCVGEKRRPDGSLDLHPGGSIRHAVVTGRVAQAGVWRVPFVADARNTQTGGKSLPPAVQTAPEHGVVMPFRYVEVRRAPFAVRETNVRRIALQWPISATAARFSSSSPALDAVWNLCRDSIVATSFLGVYVDGDRERISYEADAYLNELGHWTIDADFAMARRTYRWLLAHPTWPTEWRQNLIMMAWADWMQSGEIDLVRESWNVLVNDKLMLELAREDGLLVTGGERRKGAVRPDLGDIVDWPAGERDGFVFRPVNAVVNAFHFRNLGEMADMAAALGKPEKAKRFAARRELVRASFNRVFFRPATGLYADGEGTDHASLHANAVALAFGLVPEARKGRVADFLVGKGMACSTYFSQYLLEALFAAGRDDAAIDLMTATGDRSWLGMLAQGSTITMEAWSLKAKPNQDWNHAWGTAPLNVIVRCVLGVRPTKPGFAEYEVKPHLGTRLTHVEAVVPTVRGPIAVSAP